MNSSCIEVSVNQLRKSLPDAACNSMDKNFLIVWASAPDENFETTSYYISAQLISVTGEKLGEPIDILKTEDIIMMPRVLYNPNENQYLVIYCLGLDSFNIHGVVLDAGGSPVGNHFRIVHAPANQFHYSMALNVNQNQYLITYNDYRNEISNIYGIILDSTGATVKDEFIICNAVGQQVNPVPCYNPNNNTYLINWEDFRAHGDSLTAYDTLEVMTDISGALISADGEVLVNDIPMCMDAEGINADQRFNGIAYNPDKNHFLVSWTDTRNTLKNTGIMGRIVNADGSMAAEDFPLVNEAGAQMISHSHYCSDQKKYFIAFERDKKDLDSFYFKDISANLDVAARWLDSNGKPEGEIIDICSEEGNHRFVRFACSPDAKSILLVWQKDFPGVSDSEEGHIMSAGGDIFAKLYQY